MDNSFITDQHLSRRKKKHFQEKSRHVPRQQAFHNVYNLRWLLKTQPSDNSGQKKPAGEQLRAYLDTITGFFVQLPKQFFLGLIIFFIIGSLVAIAAITYIPPPDPPEDILSREHGSLIISAVEDGDIIPLDLTETFAWEYYTVQPGDAVETLARRHDLSLDAIIASNNLQNVRRLQAGQRIRIPNMDGIPYTVRSGDNYTSIAASMGIPLEAILDANDIQDDTISAGTVLFLPGARMDRTELRRALGELFIWPLSGRISSGFGWRNDPFTGLRSFHAALDIVVPTGTAVRASTDGRVSSTGYNSLYGNFIIISHSDDYQTMYAHLSRILVRRGSQVNQGAIIAQSGNSGRSTGPHLHFAVYKNKRAINPLDVLNK